MLTRKPVRATLSRTLFPSFADHRASCRHAALLMTQPDCVYPGVVTPSRRKPPLRWRSACQPPGGSWPSHFRIEVIEDLLDDIEILDARNDPHRSAASRTGLDVDPENPLLVLRPAHRGMAFGWRRLLRIRCRGMPASPAPPGRCHPRTVLAVRRKDPMEALQVDPRFRYQGHQPCDEIEGSGLGCRACGRGFNFRRLHQIGPDTSGPLSCIYQYVTNPWPGLQSVHRAKILGQAPSRFRAC